MTAAQRLEQLVHRASEDMYTGIFGIGPGTTRLGGAVEQRTLAVLREGLDGAIRAARQFEIR